MALANGSLMTKLVEFFVSLRELECNSVCLNVYTFLMMFDGLFIASV